MTAKLPRRLHATCLAEAKGIYAAESKWAVGRAFREVCRRTRPLNCFINAASCDRIIYALIHYLNHQPVFEILPNLITGGIRLPSL